MEGKVKVDEQQLELFPVEKLEAEYEELKKQKKANEVIINKELRMVFVIMIVFFVVTVLLPFSFSELAIKDWKKLVGSAVLTVVIFLAVRCVFLLVMLPTTFRMRRIKKQLKKLV
jgi:hypothetical protein